MFDFFNKFIFKYTLISNDSLSEPTLIVILTFTFSPIFNLGVPTIDIFLRSSLVRVGLSILSWFLTAFWISFWFWVGTFDEMIISLFLIFDTIFSASLGSSLFLLVKITIGTTTEVAKTPNPAVNKIIFLFFP